MFVRAEYARKCVFTAQTGTVARYLRPAVRHSRGTVADGGIRFGSFGSAHPVPPIQSAHPGPLRGPPIQPAHPGPLRGPPIQFPVSFRHPPAVPHSGRRFRSRFPDGGRPDDIAPMTGAILLGPCDPMTDG
nr:uncharacterized protein LOC109420465 [Aedes albopictus]XP_029720177.1 uncharacterized protein LOC109420463 [Aedes albopictus]XP_029720178.1 uncharacterized protein LOC109420464 [Aedes albopictus]XP_029720179.1 uncharacterized protein LOC109420466 [Aedes albopictus]